MDGRLVKRLVGLFRARLTELKFPEVDDPRQEQGRRWTMQSLLSGMLVGLSAGCKGLAEVELLTKNLAPALRSEFHIPRRIPDTTMRELLVKLDPDDVRRRLHQGMKAARRRKALEPTEFPVGVASFDGKVVVTRVFDQKYAQRHTSDGGKKAHGEVRMETVCLVSSRGKPCLDTTYVPAFTNEMGHFPTALKELTTVYEPGLIEIVLTDSGTTSLANASLIKEKRLEYGLALKANQPELHIEAKRLLGPLSGSEATAETTDKVGANKLVTRRVFLTEEMAGYLDWDHLRTVARVESTTEEEGRVTAREDRYFLFSMPRERFSDALWLKLVRLHWGVENNCHNTWDKILREDERPFILEPQGLYVVGLLRRIAYNLLTLYRSVTQRSEAKRATPWKELIQNIRDALVSARPEQLEGLRRRVSAPGA